MNEVGWGAEVLSSAGGPAVVAADASPRRDRCPICGDGPMRVFVEIPGIPVNCSVLMADRDEALGVTRGDLVLAVCSSCGMIRNVAFDPELLVYDRSYDNTLHFSPFFQKFSIELADRLIETHGLHGRELVEVGSGKGEFLSLLCERGENHGIGYDPSYESSEARPLDEGGVKFVAELFNAETARHSADFVCARQVLEHIDDPVAMVRGLRAAMRRPDAVLYLEVPDAGYLMAGEDVWDLNYPHCSYFTSPALARVVVDAGFRLIEIGTAFGGQFLYVDAVAGRTRDETSATERWADDVAAVSALAARFGSHFASVVDRRRELVARVTRDGRRAVLWGAGAKAVTFLNVVPGAAALDAVVDVNPRKSGRFVPGTGQRVIAPGELAACPPDTVIVMNPIYCDEIRSMVSAAGLDAEIVAANEGDGS